jgi:hypothetical protein
VLLATGRAKWKPQELLNAAEGSAGWADKCRYRRMPHPLTTVGHGTAVGASRRTRQRRGYAWPTPRRGSGLSGEVVLPWSATTFA